MAGWALRGGPARFEGAPQFPHIATLIRVSIVERPIFPLYPICNYADLIHESPRFEPGADRISTHRMRPCDFATLKSAESQFSPILRTGRSISETEAAEIRALSNSSFSTFFDSYSVDRSAISKWPIMPNYAAFARAFVNLQTPRAPFFAFSDSIIRFGYLRYVFLRAKTFGAIRCFKPHLLRVDS